jgi:hypothetical protein
MGQQQLLLLVLSTVIVGLATVAGIQAFSENQAQASQDALVQRATTIASDIQGLSGKPTQMGGVDITSSTDQATIAEKLGLSTEDFDGTTAVPAEGAGNNGYCQLTNFSDGSLDIQCDSDNAPQTVTVTVTPGADNPISTDFSS